MPLKTAFLTFDDGPQKGSDEVLAVLADAKVKAAFFVTGKNAASAGGESEQKRMLLSMQKAGHVLGNHCFSHVTQTKDQYKAAYGDLTDPAKKAAFKKNYDDNATYFSKLIVPGIITFHHARLPGDGRFMDVLVKETASLGLKHHSWTFEFAPNGVFAWVPENDWQGIMGVAASNKDLPKDGSVILLHDRHWQGAKKELLAKVVAHLQKTHELKILS